MANHMQPIGMHHRTRQCVPQEGHICVARFSMPHARMRPELVISVGNDWPQILKGNVQRAVMVTRWPWTTTCVYRTIVACKYLSFNLALHCASTLLCACADAYRLWEHLQSSAA